MLKGVDAGLGHAYYEIYRVAKASENGRQAADLSTRYFNCLRRHTNTLEQQTLAADIKAFRVLNEQAFSH